MKGSGRVGRPRAGEKGVPRSVISDREIEQFLKEHPEINASEIFRTGVRAIMPSLGLDSRIEKVQKEIDDLRADLASKEAVLNQLLREKEQREAMAFEQRLEADCHAFYLHSLIKEGRIKTILPLKPTREGILDLMVRNYGKDSVIVSGDSIRLNPLGEHVRSHVIDVRVFLRSRGIDVDRAYNIVIREDHFSEQLELSSHDEFSRAFKVTIGEWERFKADFLAGLLRDAPMEVLKDYKPQLWASIKESVKEKLRELYAGELGDLAVGIAGSSQFVGATTYPGYNFSSIQGIVDFLGNLENTQYGRAVYLIAGMLAIVFYISGISRRKARRK